jgi:DtxR family manganese transport transcriptional regulator
MSPEPEWNKTGADAISPLDARSVNGKPKKVRAPKPADGFKRTRQDHAREMGEDYVELIDDMITATGEARLVDLAAHLGVTHVTASRVIARLKHEGLVETEPYRAIFLTPAGRKLAAISRQRHQLVFDLLRALGVSAAQAHIDAEGIEHHISDATLKAISRFLKKQDTGNAD